MAALTGGQVIHDVTLTGTVTWGTAGTDTDTGTATLRALGSGKSRIDLELTSGMRTEIRDDSTGVAQGKWVNPDGKSGMYAGQNTMTDPVWFFPALGSLVPQSNVVLSYIGLETRNGETVQHLRSNAYQPSPSLAPSPTPQQLTTMDFYLDAGGSLPVAIAFNEHPDNDANINLPVEIDFSNYQTISGAQVPMHIRKVANGATLLNITLTGAVFNSGLSLSEFSFSQEAN